ncbi:MAG: inosine/xanthosine triphosphatase [Nanohaloarchaea archaeon]|nr:inosine/xanthosine triphosphatase [Candidatus Nanohaloarchaea archaeon]
MILNIGSKNIVKIEALKETINDYKFLSDAKIITKDINSDVSEQPMTIDETVDGAINRAKASYGDCDYSIGIESGFMKVKNAKTGYMEVTVCAIHDGTDTSLGFSSCFECPPKVMKNILDKDQDLTQACNSVGLTADPKLGQAQGMIGILTKGRVKRKDYTKQAITMALIQLDNRELYN